MSHRNTARIGGRSFEYEVVEGVGTAKWKVENDSSILPQVYTRRPVAVCNSPTPQYRGVKTPEWMMPIMAAHELAEGEAYLARKQRRIWTKEHIDQHALGFMAELQAAYELGLIREYADFMIRLVKDYHNFEFIDAALRR